MFNQFKTDLEGAFNGAYDNINQLSSLVEKEIKIITQSNNSEIKEQIIATYKDSFNN